MTTLAAAPPARPPRLAFAAMVGAVLSVATGASFAKGLFPAVGPEGATAIRLIVSATLLAIVFRRWGRLRPAAWRSLMPYARRSPSSRSASPSRSSSARRWRSRR